jgi:hypothetical protein
MESDNLFFKLIFKITLFFTIGLFSFIKEAGAKVFGKKEIERRRV